MNAILQSGCFSLGWRLIGGRALLALAIWRSDQIIPAKPHLWPDVNLFAIGCSILEINSRVIVAAG